MKQWRSGFVMAAFFFYHEKRYGYEILPMCES